MSLSEPTDNSDTGFGVVHRSLRGRLTSHEIAVYVALSWRANGEGRCWPRHTVLAEDAGCAVSTVKKALDGLREVGEVTWEPRVNEDGSTGSNLYTVTRLAGVPPQPPHGRGVAATRLGGSRDTATERDTENETQGRPPPQASDAAPILALVASAAEPEPALFGPPDPPPAAKKPLNGSDLFRGWCEGYQAQHGHPPDAAVYGRLRGQVREVVKSRTDEESWRRAVDAFVAAGRRGDFNVVSELLGSLSRYAPRGGVPITTDTLDLMDEMMHPERRRPATGGTR